MGAAGRCSGAGAVDPACREMDPVAALDALTEGHRFALSPLSYLYAPYGAAGYRAHRIDFHDIPALGASGQPGNTRAWGDVAVNAVLSDTYANTRMTHEAAWLRSGRR